MLQLRITGMHVMSTTPRLVEPLLAEAPALWEEFYGNCKIEAYDPERAGTFYLAKLAGSNDFDFEPVDLERMSYHGPPDLYLHAQTAFTSRITSVTSLMERHYDFLLQVV